MKMKMNGMKQIVVLIGGLMLSAAPMAQAAQPLVLPWPSFYAFYDFENELTVLWNITREDLCAWAEGGYEGDAPVIELVPLALKFTGKNQEVLVLSSQATRPIELWEGEIEPCDDASLWAYGDAHVTGNDNNVFVSETRGNTFGDRAQGTVQDVNGALWHYSWAFTAQEDAEDFEVIAENYNLKKLGK